ncbi:MAG: hypothetical protein FD174_2818 [Geobacteraceae bacterium]|nr:MAG: hypothetical protein FD174_2818 [Geobacteraceae bacterium]
MKKTFIVIVIAAICTYGCALKVIPEPVESGVVNSKDNSQTITKGGIAITVRGADTELYSYNLEGTVSAFSVLIDNQTDDEIIFDADSFLLIDNESRQYTPLTPEKVKEIVSKDSYYLIPYPYVGFYYLEDYEKSSFYNSFNSQIPYFYEIYPQDIYTKAITGGSIIPKAKVAGLVYFRIDLNDKKEVKLLVYKKRTSKSAAPDFVFPFKIKK